MSASVCACACLCVCVCVQPSSVTYVNFVSAVARTGSVKKKKNLLLNVKRPTFETSTNARKECKKKKRERLTDSGKETYSQRPANACNDVYIYIHEVSQE